MAQRTYPKADLRYWTENVFRRRRTVDGSTVEAGEFSARIQHGGRRQFFNLGTSNKAQAAAIARDIYTYLRANGWEQTLAKYKAKTQPVQITNADATIGELLAELRTKANLKPKTLEGYAVALRKIVSDIFGFPHGTGGDRGKREAWRRKVHAVRLADLTPAKVQAWKLAFVARAGDDPAKQRTARISANSFLRRAKSLFAPEVTRHLEGITLPDPSPFAGVDFYQRPSMRYRSGFDLSKLVEDARNELAETKPEQFKAFVLAVMAGLRRREIDTLEWSAFRWKDATIRIEPTRYFQPKSEDSIGDVEGESLSPEPEPRRVPGPLGSAARLRVSANSENPRIRRAYHFGVRDFTACASIERPKEVRRVTRVHLIAWL